MQLSSGQNKGGKIFPWSFIFVTPPQHVLYLQDFSYKWHHPHEKRKLQTAGQFQGLSHQTTGSYSVEFRLRPYAYFCKDVENLLDIHFLLWMWEITTIIFHPVAVSRSNTSQLQDQIFSYLFITWVSFKLETWKYGELRGIWAAHCTSLYSERRICLFSGGNLEKGKYRKRR